ncbi:hypothetical protein PUN28_009538 [Cardiocondyla obscurior]|uniref:Secreted protein n=1 Tax=Cardiocondyla obscurior TaxID=286306 RepID=A0AAW2FVY8_9HYME
MRFRRFRVNIVCVCVSIEQIKRSPCVSCTSSNTSHVRESTTTNLIFHNVLDLNKLKKKEKKKKKKEKLNVIINKNK